MARFTIIDHYLYVLKYQHLIAFDISDPTNPIKKNACNVGWGIETIFPYQGYLFLGENNGVYVYTISNRTAPQYVSQLTHARPYDPVVVQNGFAYVTLRDGNFNDDGPSSRFEIIALNDITNMQLIKTIGMDSPYGLTAQGDYVYVCDGTTGLDIFNVSDPNNAVKINTLTDNTTYDIISRSNILM